MLEPEETFDKHGIRTVG